MIKIKQLIIIFLSIVFISGCATQNAKKSDEYFVKRIVDGDTIVVDFNGKGEKVRLIGMNTPESVKPNTPVQPYAIEASNFTKKMVSRKYVRLEFDVQERDKYGRLLAYVYLPDGQMLNEVLIEDGYARLMTIPPNVKYVDRFVKLQKKARDGKKGLWK